MKAARIAALGALLALVGVPAAHAAADAFEVDVPLPAGVDPENHPEQVHREDSLLPPLDGPDRLVQDVVPWISVLPRLLRSVFSERAKTFLKKVHYFLAMPLQQGLAFD